MLEGERGLVGLTLDKEFDCYLYSCCVLRPRHPPSPARVQWGMRSPGRSGSWGPTARPRLGERRGDQLAVPLRENCCSTPFASPLRRRSGAGPHAARAVRGWQRWPLTAAACPMWRPGRLRLWPSGIARLVHAFRPPRPRAASPRTHARRRVATWLAVGRCRRRNGGHIASPRRPSRAAHPPESGGGREGRRRRRPSKRAGPETSRRRDGRKRAPAGCTCGKEPRAWSPRRRRRRGACWIGCCR